MWRSLSWPSGGWRGSWEIVVFVSQPLQSNSALLGASGFLACHTLVRERDFMAPQKQAKPSISVGTTLPVSSASKQPELTWHPVINDLNGSVSLGHVPPLLAIGDPVSETLTHSLCKATLEKMSSMNSTGTSAFAKALHHIHIR